MMRYVVLVYDRIADVDAGAASFSAWLRPAWSAVSLHASATDVRLEPVGLEDAVRLTDIHVFDCRNLDHAVAEAAGVAGGGRVEIRPVIEDG